MGTHLFGSPHIKVSTIANLLRLIWMQL